MKYILLQNGLIVQPHRVLKGDMLIGNNRIMQIGYRLQDANPETEVIDVQGEYILPGLIHFRSPFLKTEENNQASTIYIALSHGSTFLMDTLKITKTSDFKKTIEKARADSQPIITDFGLHIDAASANKLNEDDLNLCFIREGATSFILKWKHIHQLIDGKLKPLLKYIATHQLLLICETGLIKSSTLIGHPKFFTSYLKMLNSALQVLRAEGTRVLFTDVASKKELDLIINKSTPSENIFAAINLTDTPANIPGALTNDIIAAFGHHPNVILDPPLLQPPGLSHHFIENKTMYSFLQTLTSGEPVSPNALISICNMYATRPAKLLGAYPQKGTLEPGADADLIIWSPVQSDTSQKPGANTSLLRTDILGLLTNGRFITEDDLILSTQLNGRYIYRNTLFQRPPSMLTQ
ncbi:MAG: amidohydrolase family protein [Bacteroidales bacterium]|nr:amidohydrolase family protein [Bacteroidales bacterium]